MREQAPPAPSESGSWMRLIVAAVAGGIVGAWAMSLMFDTPSVSPDAESNDATSLSRDVRALSAEMSSLRQVLGERLPAVVTAGASIDSAGDPRPLVAGPDAEGALLRLTEAIGALEQRIVSGTTAPLDIPPPDPERRASVLSLVSTPAELARKVVLRTKQQILDELGRPDMIYMTDQVIERWSWMEGTGQMRGVTIDFHDGHVISCMAHP